LARSGSRSSWRRLVTELVNPDRSPHFSRSLGSRTVGRRFGTDAAIWSGRSDACECAGDRFESRSQEAHNRVERLPSGHRPMNSGGTIRGSRDPYGRPRPLAFALGIAAMGVLLLLPYAVARRYGRAAVSLGEALILLTVYLGWCAATLMVFWWRPRASAARHNGGRVLRVSPVRKAALSVFAVPLVAAFTSPAHREEPILAILLLTAAATVFALLSGSVIRFDVHGVARTSGHPKRRVLWAEVESVRVHKGEVVLLPRSGKPLRIWNRWLDGWPEFADELLLRLPTDAFRSDSERLILRDQAQLFHSGDSPHSSNGPKRDRS